MTSTKDYNCIIYIVSLYLEHSWHKYFVVSLWELINVSVLICCFYFFFKWHPLVLFYTYFLPYRIKHRAKDTVFDTGIWCDWRIAYSMSSRGYLFLLFWTFIISEIQSYECLTQEYFNYIAQVNFIGGGNLEYPQKSTDLPHVTDKLNHKML